MMKRIRKNILLIILLVLTLVGFIIIMSSDLSQYMKMKYIYCLFSLFLLVFSILLYVTKNLYWISSFTYEDYLEMNVAERNFFTKKYSSRIFSCMLFFLSYMLLSLINNFNFMIDSILFLFIIFFMAFYPFNESK